MKTYLAVSCIWAVARGQPKLDVEGFVEAMKDSANLPGGRGNQWGKILEEARVHRDEHVTKVIRSLSGWASVFGTRKARLPLKKKHEGDSSEMMEKSHDTENEADCLPPTELPGSEYLDGSLFVIVAVLTLRRTGWDFGKQVKEEGDEWDFHGFL